MDANAEFQHIGMLKKVDINDIECFFASDLHMDTPCWFNLVCNPHVFTYDYEKIKKDHTELKKELNEYFYNPRFIEKWLHDGHTLEDYLN